MGDKKNVKINEKMKQNLKKFQEKMKKLSDKEEKNKKKVEKMRKIQRKSSRKNAVYFHYKDRAFFCSKEKKKVLNFFYFYCIVSNILIIFIKFTKFSEYSKDDIYVNNIGDDTVLCGFLLGSNSSSTRDPKADIL